MVDKNRPARERIFPTVLLTSRISVPARSVVMAACESLERALKESISNVLERFDGVEKLSDEQASAVFNFIQ